MLWKDVDALNADLGPAVTVGAEDVEIRGEKALREELLDRLVYNAVFNDSDGVKEACRWIVRRCCAAAGVLPASIQSYYEAKGRGLFGEVTVPALNLRGMTYEIARAAFRKAKEMEAAALIFELARSEMSYTGQSPDEYAVVVLAAALREGYEWPVFIQGDHFQVKATKYRKDRDAELSEIRRLIDDSVAAGFYNIDIDSSTLVDLSLKDVREQQRENFQVAAELTSYLRERQPQGVVVSAGVEIGEVGGTNSTVEELSAFMDGCLDELKRRGVEVGPSKVSVQTGTTHGGIVLPDGSLAQVMVDFDALGRLSSFARERYGVAGAVQHGASTLPVGAFDHFPRVGCAEIHLATGFQNIIYDNPRFPEELKEEIYSFLRSEFGGERKPSESEDQFIYKTRKKAFGPYKRAFWDLPREAMEPILEELEARFALLFEKLGTRGSAEGIVGHVKPVSAPAAAPASLARPRE